MSLSPSHPRRHPAQQGAILVVSLFFMLLLIMLLAVVVGLGLLHTLGETLQQATVNASLVGASALWNETDAQGQPRLSPQAAEQAARATFRRQVEAIPLLSSMGANLTQLNVDTGQQTLTLAAQGTFQVPLLASLNLSQLRLNGASTARYAVHEPALPLTQLGGGGAGEGACANQGPTDLVIPLQVPLTNRPGPDLLINTSNGAGYRVLACSGNTCRDIGGAALPLNGGTTMVRQAPASASHGTPVNVVYGSALFDLGASSEVYHQAVNKATRIHIIDDGIPDVWDGEQRLLDTCPAQGVAIASVQVLHQAHLCVANQGVCVAPQGLQAPWAGL